MKKIVLMIILAILLVQPVSATSFTAPEVPDSGDAYMPPDIQTFGEGLWFVVKSAISAIKPEIAQAARLCASVIAAALLTSLIHGLSSYTKQITEIAAAVGIGLLLLQPSSTLIRMGTETVSELSEYGKLLLPVMTSAMAAQGGVSTSAALYTGTTLFSTVLTDMISGLIVPMVYFFLCLCIANSAVGEDVLKKLRDFLQWLITWSLKIVLYIFTGYISITGVVSGSADASMVKATKLAISGSVPVVGGILSDASESILVSAGIMKNAAGIYGVLAIIATWIGPFLQIGIQYLLLKVTSAVCGVFGPKQIAGLVQDFSSAMGFILAMVSAISLLLLISLVCFMKGVS